MYMYIGLVGLSGHFYLSHELFFDSFFAPAVRESSCILTYIYIYIYIQPTRHFDRCIIKLSFYLEWAFFESVLRYILLFVYTQFDHLRVVSCGSTLCPATFWNPLQHDCAVCCHDNIIVWVNIYQTTTNKNYDIEKNKTSFPPLRYAWKLQTYTILKYAIYLLNTYQWNNSWLCYQLKCMSRLSLQTTVSVFGCVKNAAIMFSQAIQLIQESTVLLELRVFARAMKL